MRKIVQPATAGLAPPRAGRLRPAETPPCNSGPLGSAAGAKDTVSARVRIGHTKTGAVFPAPVFVHISFFFCNRCKAYNSTTVDSSDAVAEKSGTTSSAAAGIADLPYIAVKPCKTTEQTAVRPARRNLSPASVRSAAQVANRFSAWNWTSRIAGGHQRTVQPRHRPTKDSRSCA